MFLGVLAAMLLAAAGTPEPADAFIGESLVINPVTKDLTEAAKTIITKPTFIAENVGEAAAAAGEIEAGGAAAVFEGSAIPALGTGLLGLGAGVGIGSLVCHHVGIEGCLFFESDGPQASTEYLTGTIGAKGEWVFIGTPLTYLKEWYDFGKTANPDYKYGFWYRFSTGTENYAPPNIVGHDSGWEKAGCGKNYNAPPDVSVWIPSALGGTCLSKAYFGSGAFKSTMRGRKLRHVTTAEAEALKGEGRVSKESSFEPSSEVTKKIAAAIEGQSGNAPAAVGEKIASQIPGSGVENPYAKITVPSCDGLSATDCIALLESVGLTPSVAYLDWGTAVIPDVNLEEPILSLEAQAEKVQSVSPKTGVKVVKGSKVEVVANPDIEGMPLIVPSDPAPGETVEEYTEKRLEPMAPVWTVNEETLTDATLDPGYDPSTVVRPLPKPGTRMDPAAEPEIDVKVNPPTAPVVGGGGGDCGGTIGAVDWSPLNQPVGSKFPFGVFGFFVGWIGGWEAGDGAPPDWTVTFLPEGVFGSKGLETQIDLAFMAPVVGPARLLFLFASFVGLLWFLGTAAAKLQGDGS